MIDTVCTKCYGTNNTCVCKPGTIHQAPPPTETLKTYYSQEFKDTMKQVLTSYEGNATRSVLKERYDLIPKEAVDAMARRLTLGAEKHGDNNWKGGGEEFRKACINHLWKHLLEYMANGNKNDANSDAIICNAAFLCYFEEKLGPYK